MTSTQTEQDRSKTAMDRPDPKSAKAKGMILCNTVYVMYSNDL